MSDLITLPPSADYSSGPRGMRQAAGGVVIDARGLVLLREPKNHYGGYCVPLDTQILTQRGWLAHFEVVVGDQTLGYDPQTKTLKWTRITAVHHPGVQPLVLYGSPKLMQVRCTPDHRWVTTTGMRTATAQRTDGEKTIFSAPFDDSSHARDVTPDEAALVAWIVTDGHFVNVKRTAFECGITQLKPSGIAHIDALLARMDFPHTKRVDYGGMAHYRLAAHGVRRLIERTGYNGDKRSLPEFVRTLPPDAVRGFLDAAYAAEGCVSEKARTCLWQNEGPCMEALQLAAYLCGYLPAVRHTNKPTQNQKVIGAGGTLRLKRLSMLRAHIRDVVTRPVESDEVWCVTTELGTWTMRQGDYVCLTGNCWTFAKGGVDAGETAPRAALREVREETGWTAHIVSRLGVFSGDTTETTYFLMRPVRKAGRHDAETQSLKWVSREDAERMIGQTVSTKGKIRDLAVLKLAYEAHLRATGGKMSAEESIMVESVRYQDIHARTYTPAELQWMYDNVKSPEYVVTFEEWAGRHYQKIDEAYGIETTKSGFDDVGSPTAADQAKVDAVMADTSLPATAEAGKAYIVHWADGRGIFACRRKDYLPGWLKEQGEWAEIISITYGDPRKKKLRVVEGVRTDYACPRCGSHHVLVREAHADTGMDEMEGRCQSCGYNDDISQFGGIAYDDGESANTGVPPAPQSLDDPSFDFDVDLDDHATLSDLPRGISPVQHINEDAFEDALINGKAVLIDNVWWAVASRDVKANRVILAVSKYALADGNKQQKPKVLSFSKLVANIKSGKWGANINGRRYGPKQDAKARDNVRKSAGLTAAPGAGKFRKEADEAVIRRSASAETPVDADPVLTYLRLYTVAEDWTDAADLESMSTNAHAERDEADVYWAVAHLYWNKMTTEAQEEAHAIIEANRYREIVGAAPRGSKAAKDAEKFPEYPNITAYNRTFESIVEAAIPKAVAAREAMLRKRGFTYRANNAPPPKRKGYPPMVRKWAKDEGFPLPTMQRMWDMAVEDVDTGGELDRPGPGDHSRKAIEFWKETTRMFRSMVHTRKKMEAAG